MQIEGEIIGLTGPSGIGKGYIKEHIKTMLPDVYELTVATTRGRRDSDGVDRDTDIPVGLFLQRRDSGEIVFAHQPFGADGDWYGFYDEQISKFLSEGRGILTEIHVENVGSFKQRYGDSVFIVGLIASQDYLLSNLIIRETESAKIARRRLDAGLAEVAAIRQMYAQGDINALIEVNDAIRAEVAVTAWKHIEQAFSPRKELA